MDAMDNNISSLSSGQNLSVQLTNARSAEFEDVSSQSKLKQGKSLVFAGSAVCIIGVLVYCMSLVSGDFSLSGSDGNFLKAGLMIIAGGFMLWLFGAVKYVNAAIDLGSGEDMF